jgi:small subunit ribosomal protein S15
VRLGDLELVERRNPTGKFARRRQMLDKKTKDRIIKIFKTHESDTGSSPVQIAILTEEIKQLTKHLKEHKKDFSSRRGLLRKVAERRKLLNYLRREDIKAYEKITKELKLKVVEPAKEEAPKPDVGKEEKQIDTDREMAVE